MKRIFVLITLLIVFFIGVTCGPLQNIEQESQPLKSIYEYFIRNDLSVDISYNFDMIKLVYYENTKEPLEDVSGDLNPGGKDSIYYLERLDDYEPVYNLTVYDKDNQLIFERNNLTDRSGKKSDIPDSSMHDRQPYENTSDIIEDHIPIIFMINDELLSIYQEEQKK